MEKTKAQETASKSEGRKVSCEERTVLEQYWKSRDGGKQQSGYDRKIEH